MSKALDRVDRRILDELQGDARVSNQELAKRVGLSPAPCWRRLRRLEEEGFVNGYATLLDGPAVGLPILAAHPGLGGALTPAAVQAVFLAYLGRWPDSHIVRKHGTAMGQFVTQEAAPWHTRSARGEAVDADPAFAAWLRAAGFSGRCC